MSYTIETLHNTGRKITKLHCEELEDGVDLNFAVFAGQYGPMIQITQGFGGSSAMKPLSTDEPGYIQLTIDDAYRSIQILTKWIREESLDKATKIQKQIDKDQALKETIFQDAVECQRFIRDLKTIEIPLKLLS